MYPVVPTVISINRPSPYLVPQCTTIISYDRLTPQTTLSLPAQMEKLNS